MLRRLSLAALLVAFAIPASAGATTVGVLLGALPVATETTQPVYERSAFEHWIRVNGCTTRQWVLFRQNTATPKPACSSSKGRWFSVYDGRTFTTASGLDIDHFIPLAEAWRSGASGWNADTRKRFANDRTYGRSLIAVSASSNRSKGDKDPALWMPTRTAYHCAYAVSWVAVKYRWKLAVNQTEKTKVLTVLRGCPAKVKTLPVPPRAAIVAGAAQPNPSDPTPTNPSPTALPGDANGIDPRFDTCGAAQAAGYGPYTRGVHTEYSWYRDGDSDGTVCE